MVGSGIFGIYTEGFQCAQCGKFRYKNAAWIYKRSVPAKKKGNYVVIHFCSYGCMRAWDKEKERAKAK